MIILVFVILAVYWVLVVLVAISFVFSLKKEGKNHESGCLLDTDILMSTIKQNQITYIKFALSNFKVGDYKGAKHFLETGDQFKIGEILINPKVWNIDDPKLIASALIIFVKMCNREHCCTTEEKTNIIELVAQAISLAARKKARLVAKTMKELRRLDPNISKVLEKARV